MGICKLLAYTCEYQGNYTSPKLDLYQNDSNLYGF